MSTPRNAVTIKSKPRMKNIGAVRWSIKEGFETRVSEIYAITKKTQSVKFLKNSELSLQKVTEMKEYFRFYTYV